MNQEIAVMLASSEGNVSCSLLQELELNCTRRSAQPTIKIFPNPGGTDTDTRVAKAGRGWIHPKLDILKRHASLPEHMEFLRS